MVHLSGAPLQDKFLALAVNVRLVSDDHWLISQEQH